MSEDDRSRIKLAISEALSERCNCLFSQNHIVHDQILCSSGSSIDSIIFQGTLISTEDADSVELLFHLQEWLLTEPTIGLDGVVLQGSENCQVYLKEPGNITNNSCEWPPNKLREYRRITTGVSIGMGFSALIAFSALTITAVACCWWKHKILRKHM